MKLIDNIKNRIENAPILGRIIQWSKTHSLPGFSKIPIYDIIVFFINEIRRDSLETRANSIAFSFFLSLFPAILVFFTLIPFILPYFQDYIIPLIADHLIVRTVNGAVDFNQTLIAQFNELMDLVQVIPDSVREQLIHFIDGVLLKPRFGLLSFGFVLALFFSSNGMLTMMHGFEKMNRQTFRRRNVVEKRLIAIQLTFLLGSMVFAALFFIILGDSAINWVFGAINANAFIHFFVQLLRVITIFIMFYLGISLLYRIGVPTRKKLPYFTAGTTLATFSSLITSWAFAIYVNNYSKYDDLYGSIGTFIVIMLWIQINAFILLIGFELNASIAVNRDIKRARIEKDERRRKALEEE